jgi:hypothetical protein
MSIYERRKLFENSYTIVPSTVKQLSINQKKLLENAVQTLKQQKINDLYRKHLLLTLVRRYITKKNNAAIKIQRWYRNWKKFYYFRQYCQSQLSSRKMNFQHSATVIQRCFRQFLEKKHHYQIYQKRLNAVVTIQRFYRQIIENRKKECLSRGIDPMETCPITHAYAYSIPIEKLLIFNMGKSMKVCDLSSYLKWILQFDFSDLPTHFWSTKMTKHEFENVLKFSEMYIQSLCTKMHYYWKLHNQKLKTDIHYDSIYLKQYNRLQREFKENEEMIIKIKKINYYRCHQHQKLEELESEYNVMIQNIEKNIFRIHPIIRDQVMSNRSITLMESYTLSLCYKHEFLESVEKEIARYENLRQYIDNLYKKFGMVHLIQNKTTTTFKEVSQPVIPSAPPLEMN